MFVQAHVMFIFILQHNIRQFKCEENETSVAYWLSTVKCQHRVADTAAGNRRLT